MSEQTPAAPNIDPTTGIHKPEVAEVVYVDNIVLKGSGIYTDGEIFNDVAYRVPKRLWITDMKGTTDGFKAWMSKHDPRLRTAEKWDVTLVREESTDSRTYRERPAV